MIKYETNITTLGLQDVEEIQEILLREGHSLKGYGMTNKLRRMMEDRINDKISSAISVVHRDICKNYGGHVHRDSKVVWYQRVTSNKPIYSVVVNFYKDAVQLDTEDGETYRLGEKIAELQVCIELVDYFDSKRRSK